MTRHNPANTAVAMSKCPSSIRLRAPPGLMPSFMMTAGSPHPRCAIRPLWWSGSRHARGPCLPGGRWRVTKRSLAQRAAGQPQQVATVRDELLSGSTAFWSSLAIRRTAKPMCIHDVARRSYRNTPRPRNFVWGLSSRGCTTRSRRPPGDHQITPGSRCVLCCSVLRSTGRPMQVPAGPIRLSAIGHDAKRSIFEAIA